MSLFEKVHVPVCRYIGKYCSSLLYFVRLVHTNETFWNIILLCVQLIEKSVAKYDTYFLRHTETLSHSVCLGPADWIRNWLQMLSLCIWVQMLCAYSLNEWFRFRTFALLWLCKGFVMKLRFRWMVRAHKIYKHILQSLTITVNNNYFFQL